MSCEEKNIRSGTVEGGTGGNPAGRILRKHHTSRGAISTFSVILYVRRFLMGWLLVFLCVAGFLSLILLMVCSLLYAAGFSLADISELLLGPKDHT